MTKIKYRTSSTSSTWNTIGLQQIGAAASSHTHTTDSLTGTFSSGDSRLPQLIQYIDAGPTTNVTVSGVSNGQGRGTMIPHITADSMGRVTEAATYSLTVPTYQNAEDLATGKKSVTINSASPIIVTNNSTSDTNLSYTISHAIMTTEDTTRGLNSIPTDTELYFNGGSVSIPYYTINRWGHISSGDTRTLKMPTVTQYTLYDGEASSYQRNQSITFSRTLDRFPQINLLFIKYRSDNDPAFWTSVALSPTSSRWDNNTPIVPQLVATSSFKGRYTENKFLFRIDSGHWTISNTGISPRTTDPGRRINVWQTVDGRNIEVPDKANYIQILKVVGYAGLW